MTRYLVLVGVCFLTACGAAPVSSPQVSDVATRQHPSAAHTKAAAAAEAQQLLDEYVPPRGAARLRSAPTGRWLQRDPGAAIFGKRVARQRFWRVPESVAAIQASIEGHRLRGWGSAGTTSTGGEHGGLLNTYATYAVPGFGGRSTGRLLSVAAVKARGGGSLLRVDVVVVWQLSAAQREDLPAGVSEIDIRGPRADQQVTDPTQVRTIVRWFDRLEIAQQLYLYLGCPPSREPSFGFVFRGAHGATLARASVPEFSSYCSAAMYSIGGHAEKSLLGGNIVYRVQELIGANWIGPTDVAGIASHRKAEAQHKAAVLLHNFRPPPGAKRTGAPKEYGGVLNSIGRPLGEAIDQTRFWRVPASLSRVIAFVEAHDVPRGFTTGGGRISGGGSPPNQQIDFYNKPFDTKFLEVSALQTRTGTTILRVDTQVVWVYPRSPKERIPAGVREIDFSTPTLAKRVTNPAVIARIVRWFDALPIVPPGIGTPPCPLVQTTPVTLDFHDAGGAVLAHVAVDAIEPKGLSGICDPIAVQILGGNQPSLLGENFIGRVQREIGVTVKAPQQ